jgi:hypothetical protein
MAEEIPMTAELMDATVESYAGYKGEETPRAVVVQGARFEVLSIVDRKRVLDRDGGGMREIWRCRLEGGWEATVERLEDGTWRVSART